MPLHTDEGLELRQKVDEPLFPEERPGWKGYIEWEKYPDKKQKAAEILKQYNFPPVSQDDIVFDTTCMLIRLATGVSIGLASLSSEQSAPGGSQMEAVSSGIGSDSKANPRH